MGELTYSLPELGTPNTAADPLIRTALAQIKSEYNAEQRASRWYPPSIVATEQPRTNVAFGLLATPDEVKGVVLPANGLIAVVYRAAVMSSNAGAGRAAIFLSANQLAADDGAGNLREQEVSTIGGSEFATVFTGGGGLTAQGNGTPIDVTTGAVAAGWGPIPQSGGVCLIYAAAGTYDVSVKFRATGGSVTARNRKLWVYTLGV